MDARNNIAQDLFYKIRSRFAGLKLGAESGEITIMPNEARFFDFDYAEDDTPIGHVSISLAEPNSMKVYFSNGITEKMNPEQKARWYRFLKELRTFAKRRLMAFDTRDIAKDNLDQRDYAFLSQNAKPKQQSKDQIQKPVGESVMNESSMYGTKTVSYQKLMDTRLIIKHSRALQDDAVPGARSRNISALFVENQDGERFKYPFIHLAGARAMQRHVANGGVPYDDIGKSIVEMSEQIAQLRSFSNYVVKNDLMNSDTNPIVERSGSALTNLRETIAKLSKQSFYEQYRENFQAGSTVSVPDEVIEDFTEKFTVKNFKEDIKSVFPVLYKLMQEHEQIDYNDIVEMTSTEPEHNDSAEIVENDDPFEKFEDWVNEVGEASAIASSDEQEKAAAVHRLQQLVDSELPVGVDASNAIESVKGIIEDPSFFRDLKNLAKEDEQRDARPLVKAWLEENAPDVLDEIEMKIDPQDSDKTSEAQETDQEQRPGSNLSVKELAEFIYSFYDKASGTFPRGPEGVATMVRKKYGEEAERVARQFIGRLAPQQEQANPADSELDRIRHLSGVQTESEEDVIEMDYQSFHTDEKFKILRDALNANKIVSVAVVKKDGTVGKMAARKNLSAYVPSTRPKTDKQANVNQNNDLIKVVNMNAYKKQLADNRAAGMEESEAKAKAAARSWRSISLPSVLGFLVGGQFIDVRDENEIMQRFGEEVYNSLTPNMKKSLDAAAADAATVQTEDFDDDISDIQRLSGL